MNIIIVQHIHDIAKCTIEIMHSKQYILVMMKIKLAVKLFFVYVLHTSLLEHEI